MLNKCNVFGFEFSMSSFLVFYKKMTNLKIVFDEFCVKSLLGLGSSSD